MVVVASNIELLREDDDKLDISTSGGEIIIGEEIDAEEVIDVEIAVMALRDVNEGENRKLKTCYLRGCSRHGGRNSGGRRWRRAYARFIR